MRVPWLRQAILTTASLALLASPALGLSVLVAPGSNQDIDIVPRLIELGHTVQESDPATWDALFDYSAYDVVAFSFSSADPADIPHLVAAVDAEEVGVVFFRGNGALATAMALGLTASTSMDFQSGHQCSVTDNSHPITHNLDVTTYDLGYTNMSYVADRGINTTILAVGPDGAALVAHNSRRAVVTPFYGHPAGYDTETTVGKGITDRSLRWAASEPLPEVRTTWGQVKALYAD